VLNAIPLLLKYSFIRLSGRLQQRLQRPPKRIIYERQYVCRRVRKFKLFFTLFLFFIIIIIINFFFVTVNTRYTRVISKIVRTQPAVCTLREPQTRTSVQAPRQARNTSTNVYHCTFEQNNLTNIIII